MPGERKVSEHDADVIARIGDPLLREVMDKVLAIGAYFGDNEAYLSQEATDIVSSLEVVAKTLLVHPEQSIATMLARMPHDEKLQSIAQIRAMLDHIEANTMPDIPTNAVFTMLTGTRTIADPDGVRAALVKVINGLSKENPVVGICGGAQGADQLFAEACIETESYFVMVVPNRYYPYFYDRVEDFTKLKESPFCLGFEYTVDRPEVDDWRDRWKREMWWKDNFARNIDMIDRAREAGGKHIVCGPNHPKVIFENKTIKGGTADATRRMLQRDVHEVVYVQSDNPENILWVTF